MSTTNHLLNMSKKPASKDWHRAQVVAAVRMADETLAGLSRKHGYAVMTLRNALYLPATKYERIIAEILGTTPQKIWPSRYHKDGTPKSGRGERGIGRFKAKFNGSARSRNVNLTGTR